MLGLCNTFTSVSQPAVNRYKGTRSCVWDSTSDFLYNSSASSTNTVLGMNRISADTTYTQAVMKTDSSHVRKTVANDRKIQYTINIEYANPLNTNS